MKTLLNRFLLISCFFLPLCLPAQEHSLRFKRYTIDNGLSQNNVNCILQDSKGFMWFGTNGGLNRFDGYEFLIFERESQNPGKLSDDYIRCMIEDHHGYLWIGTGNGGINIYNRKSNQFINYNSSASSELQLSHNDIRTLLEDDQGIIWAATVSSIERIDPGKKTVESCFPDNFKRKNSVQVVINVMYYDSHKKFWFGTQENGLGLFDPGEKSYHYFCHNDNNEYSISDNNIRSIYEDSEGNFWIGTYNGGINLFDREENKFYHFFPDPNKRESLTIKSILDDNKGNLWLGTRDGLYIFNKKTKRFYNHNHDTHNPKSISQNNVQVIYKDNKGDFWLGTKIGINFVNTTGIPFVHYRVDAYSSKCLNQGFVNSIHEDREGHLWFGTSEGGLNRLNPGTGLFTYYIHDPKDPGSLGSNNVNTMVEDNDGNLWIGTTQGGLNFFNRKTKRFYKQKILPDIPLLHQPVIDALIYNSDHSLWINSNDGGLLRFQIKDRKFRRHPRAQRGSKPVVQSIFRSNDSTIWIGGRNSHIYKYDKTTEEIQAYKLPLNTETTRINDITEDRNNILWIATNGGGLVSYNRTKNDFRKYTKNNGLPHNDILSILIDSDDNLWISTVNGLAKFNPETGDTKTYYKENGLQDNQFRDAACKTRSGRMFFGGINGITAFYPDEILENTFIPPVVVTDFKIFNKSVPIGGDKPIIEKTITEEQKINLSYKHTSFTFKFAALNYAISEHNQYAYMMDGFEKDWNYVGTRRFATYTNLDPGLYTFKVKAANSDGIWNEKGTSIQISISPPFWRTWWFKVIITAILILIIYHFVNYQNQKRNLLKIKALANLTQLRLLRNQMNPHFLLNTLSAIRGLVLLEPQQGWEMISKLSEFLRYVLVNYNKAEDTLEGEIEAAKNYIIIQKVCFHENLKVSYHIDDNTKSCIVPAFIFQPLIENAIKFGSETNSQSLQIEVNISYHQGILSIDISNTGKLISCDKKEEKNRAHGNSIVNIQKRLTLMYKDEFDFRIYEEDGWVHARITINYNRVKKNKIITSKTFLSISLHIAC